MAEKRRFTKFFNDQKFINKSPVKSLKKSQTLKENDQYNNTQYYTVGQYITVSNSFYATLETENRKNTMGKVLLKITLGDFSLFLKTFCSI